MDTNFIVIFSYFIVIYRIIQLYEVLIAMSFQNQFTKTTTDANLMETVHHGNAEYPFRYYYENIALFDFKCIDWHWHSELEFIYIESGNVVFDIGTVHFELNEGNGIMINSKILHRLQS